MCSVAQYLISVYMYLMLRDPGQKPAENVNTLLEAFLS